MLNRIKYILEQHIHTSKNCFHTKVSGNGYFELSGILYVVSLILKKRLDYVRGRAMILHNVNTFRSRRFFDLTTIERNSHNIFSQT